MEPRHLLPQTLALAFVTSALLAAFGFWSMWGDPPGWAAWSVLGLAGYMCHRAVRNLLALRELDRQIRIGLLQDALNLADLVTEAVGMLLAWVLVLFAKVLNASIAALAVGGMGVVLGFLLGGVLQAASGLGAFLATGTVVSLVPVVLVARVLGSVCFVLAGVASFFHDMPV